MNHFRELLEQQIRAAPHNRRALIEKASRNTVCFYCGAVVDYDALRSIPELVRLPFFACWFEFVDADGSFFGMTCVQSPGTKRVSLCMYARERGTHAWLAEAQAGTEADFETIVGVNHGASMDLVRKRLRLLRCFLSALNCSNVKRQEHLPNSKIQKAREKRGKAPLFSYWTLQLDGKKERGEDQGGTHASPRVHLRRGHPRQYMAGKWTWVQAHAVGNRAAGIVHKDYSAGPAMAAAAR